MSAKKKKLIVLVGWTRPSNPVRQGLMPKNVVEVDFNSFSSLTAQVVASTKAVFVLAAIPSPQLTQLRKIFAGSGAFVDTVERMPGLFSRLQVHLCESELALVKDLLTEPVTKPVWYSPGVNNYLSGPLGKDLGYGKKSRFLAR